MERIISALLRHRIPIILTFLALLILSVLAIPGVQINYDLAHYLPKDSPTQQAITVMEEEFGYPGIANVLVEADSIPQALAAKAKLRAVPGVKSVLWLDDLTDIHMPHSFIPEDLLTNYYRDGAALFQVEFHESNYSLEAGEALSQIRKALGEGVCIVGPAEDTKNMREILATEIFRIMVIVVPIFFLILIFASRSWVEPLLYLVVIGVSILLNMGTNIFFPSISFITHAMAAVLQLAISMDYSLFLCHRYIEERDIGLDAKDAVLIATKNTLSSISASSLTTIAGFLALVFMQYKIGADIGLVLAKGITISFLCVLILLPIMLYALSRQIDKTRHRQFTPTFARWGKAILKYRYVIGVGVLLIVVPFILAQGQNHYLYGDTSGSSQSSQQASEHQRIEELFGVSNPVMLLVPNNDINSEILLVETLAANPLVREVTALVTLADPTIPREFIPQEVRESFLSEKFSRIIVDLAVAGETPRTFEVVDYIQDTAQQYYPDAWYTAGAATSIADIKATVESDIFLVSVFSLGAVGLIVLLTFKSLSIPVLLVLVIQASIWINMGVPYFSGTSLVFIGYLVIKSLQLGATIDYAILLSNRYLAFRSSLSPQESALAALRTSGGSILVSALVLSVAGYAEGLLSGIDAISAIGVLLGRGAALSGIMVLTVLPVLLVIFDRLIMRTTWRPKPKSQKDRSVEI